MQFIVLALLLSDTVTVLFEVKESDLDYSNYFITRTTRKALQHATEVPYWYLLQTRCAIWENKPHVMKPMNLNVCFSVISKIK